VEVCLIKKPIAPEHDFPTFSAARVFPAGLAGTTAGNFTP
jgi:hypothetical protein